MYVSTEIVLLKYSSKKQMKEITLPKMSFFGGGSKDGEWGRGK
jgi:hypothetical protein